MYPSRAQAQEDAEGHFCFPGSGRALQNQSSFGVTGLHPLLHRRWQNKLGQRKCGCGHQSCSAQRFWTVPRTQDLLQLCVGISQGPQMVPNQRIAGLFLLFGFLAAGWGAKK